VLFLISLIPLIWRGGLGAGGVVEGLQAASRVLFYLFIWTILIGVLYVFGFCDLVGGPVGWRGGRGPAGCLTGFVLFIYPMLLCVFCLHLISLISLI